MLGQYIITFREVFEAALIVSVMLAYLSKVDLGYLKKQVWLGVGASVLSSIIIGAIILYFYDGLSEASAKLFEAVAAFVAVVLLTWAILFIAKEKHTMLEQKTADVVSKGAMWGVFGFAFIAVFREGLETVLFLTPFYLQDATGTIIGVILGFVTALAISFGVFWFGMHTSVKKLFFYSSILLVLLAAGLLGYGVHELLEYFEIAGIEAGFLATKAFTLPLESGSLFHHKGVIGSVFSVLFGYSASMEWGRVLAHVAYLAVFLPMLFVKKK